MRSIDLTKLIAQTYLDNCGGMDLSYLWDVALGCYGWDGSARNFAECRL